MVAFGLLREQRWSSQVGDWGPGKYKLSASGSGGLDFFNETELTYEHKSYSVFGLAST